MEGPGNGPEVCCPHYCTAGPCALRPQNSQGRLPCPHCPWRAVSLRVSLWPWCLPALPQPGLDQTREQLALTQAGAVTVHEGSGALQQLTHG